MAEEATGSKDGPSSGWADAMAKVLNKKIPQNKSTILAKNKTLEKERERKKQERQEKKMRVRKRCSTPCAVSCQMGYMQDSLRALSQISAEAVSVLESLLHRDLEDLVFFLLSSHAV